MENLELDNLKDALKQIDKTQLPDNNEEIISTKPSWSSICLYIAILMAAVIAAIYRFYWKPKSAKTIVQQPSVKAAISKSSRRTSTAATAFAASGTPPI